VTCWTCCHLAFAFKYRAVRRLLCQAWQAQVRPQWLQLHMCCEIGACEDILYCSDCGPFQARYEGSKRFGHLAADCKILEQCIKVRDFANSTEHCGTWISVLAAMAKYLLVFVNSWKVRSFHIQIQHGAQQPHSWFVLTYMSS
jgi:hypothetical protein